MNKLYTKGREHYARGDIATLTDTIKLAAVSGAYVQSDAHEFFSSISNIIAAGVALTTKTALNGILTADPIVFPSVTAGATIAGLVLYKDTGTAGTSPLIAWYDTNADTTPITITTTGSNITMSFATANGYFKL